MQQQLPQQLPGVNIPDLINWQHVGQQADPLSINHLQGHAFGIPDTHAFDARLQPTLPNFSSFAGKTWLQLMTAAYRCQEAGSVILADS